MKQTFVRSEFNYDMREAGKASAFVKKGKSRVQQHMKDEADINTIVRRFGVTGQLPVNVKVPSYETFDDVFDFRSAMDAVVEAERSFAAMPWDVRKRFANDPQQFVEFCSDERNLPEMRKLGLAVPEVVLDTASVEKPKE